MRGCVLGDRCRTSVRAFGVARMISLKNQDPSGTCGNRRSGVLGRRSQFATRPLGWSDLNRLLEQVGAPGPCQISIPKPAGIFSDEKLTKASTSVLVLVMTIAIARCW